MMAGRIPEGGPERPETRAVALPGGCGTFPAAMHVEYHKWFSPRLQQDFELKVYGHAGRPLVVFPSQDGRFYDFENFGMVDAIAGFIHSGRLRVFAIDGRDWEAWNAHGKHPHDRARRADEYDATVAQEVVPFVRAHSSPLHDRDVLVTGCSMGAFHAVNYFFRHPDQVATVIALSGVYQLRTYLGDYMDDRVYFHSPLHYLPSLDDPWYLDRYRQSQIVLCCGQGRWEEECLEDTRRLSSILASKGVPHWMDLWGPDVDHDWPWWRKQLPYFLDHVLR